MTLELKPEDFNEFSRRLRENREDHAMMALLKVTAIQIWLDMSWYERWRMRRAGASVADIIDAIAARIENGPTK